MGTAMVAAAAIGTAVVAAAAAVAFHFHFKIDLLYFSLSLSLSLFHSLWRPLSVFGVTFHISQISHSDNVALTTMLLIALLP